MPRNPGPKTRRLEFTLFKEGSELLAELEAEATAREVSLQQHMFDILKARSLARQGKDYNELLWIPRQAEATPESKAEQPKGAAGAAADAWLGMMNEG